MGQIQFNSDLWYVMQTCRITTMRWTHQHYKRESKWHTLIWMMEAVLAFLSRPWKQWAFNTILSHLQGLMMQILVRKKIWEYSYLFGHWIPWSRKLLWMLTSLLCIRLFGRSHYVSDYIWLLFCFCFFSFLSVHSHDGREPKREERLEVI